MDKGPARFLSGSVGALAALVAIVWPALAAADPPPPKDPQVAPAAPFKVDPGAEPPSHYEDSVTPTLDNGSLQRVLSVLTGSVGLAGLGVGGVFGGLALSRWHLVKVGAGTCRDPLNFTGCPEQLQRDQRAASSYATVSNFSFITGSLFVAGGITMWYLAPRRPTKAARIDLVPVLGPGGAGGFVVGAF